MTSFHTILCLNKSVLARKNRKNLMAPAETIKDPWTVAKKINRRILRKHGEEALPSINTTVNGTFLGGGEAMAVTLTLDYMPDDIRRVMKHNIEQLRIHWRNYSTQDQ
jgi:hypothetical protein